MKHSKTTFAAIALTLSFCCSAVQGALVTFEFAATVSEVPVELASQFSIGQSIRGSYTFESSTLPNDSTYYSAIRSFNVDIAGYELNSHGLGDIEVLDGAPDSYIAVSFSSGNSVGGLNPGLHAIQMNDHSGTALTSNKLPLVPPDVSKFADRRFTVDFPGARLTGNIDRLVAVPEPSSAVVLPLAALLCARRRRE